MSNFRSFVVDVRNIRPVSVEPSCCAQAAPAHSNSDKKPNGEIKLFIVTMYLRRLVGLQEL